ncbi:hypothetical protein CEXT_634531, partial [Caerostris extrusa]
MSKPPTVVYSSKSKPTGYSSEALESSAKWFRRRSSRFYSTTASE